MITLPLVLSVRTGYTCFREKKMLDTRAGRYLKPVLDKAAGVCMLLRLTPTVCTIGALIIGVCTGLFVYLEKPVIAVILLWVSGFLDALDGTVARRAGAVSGMGAVMDSTFDRIVELSVIWGVAFRTPSVAVSLIVLTSSIIVLTSVTLSAEAVARDRNVTVPVSQAALIERSETLILLSLMILLPGLAGWIAVIFAGLVFFTAYKKFADAGRSL
jgi:archaetidylinositol phosphate synthase